jgi:hypothetical protein
VVFHFAGSELAASVPAAHGRERGFVNWSLRQNNPDPHRRSLFDQIERNLSRHTLTARSNVYLLILDDPLLSAPESLPDAVVVEIRHDVDVARAFRSRAGYVHDNIDRARRIRIALIESDSKRVIVPVFIYQIPGSIGIVGISGAELSRHSFTKCLLIGDKSMSAGGSNAAVGSAIESREAADYLIVRHFISGETSVGCVAIVAFRRL